MALTRKFSGIVLVDLMRTEDLGQCFGLVMMPASTAFGASFWPECRRLTAIFGIPTIPHTGDCEGPGVAHNPRMTFIYVSGAGTDSSERCARLM